MKYNSGDGVCILGEVRVVGYDATWSCICDSKCVQTMLE